jgi:dipeptide/tripeptide permease
MSAFLERVRGLGRPFWMLCTMEMWERLAYYGVRVVVGIYIAQADAPGGLHWAQAERAQIFFWWAIFQSVLPTFTGGIADRYGYKRTIFASITLKMVGYLLMATQREYAGFFAGALLLATGTAIFKPGIQGSLAHNLTKDSASFGWGIFYWLVNVGGLIGPPFAAYLRGENQWDRVFYGCAAIVALNYGMLFTYAEPPSGADLTKSFGAVMRETFANFFEARLLAFLAILTGFWLMMYQLWDFHPFFIVDWIDSSPVYDTLHLPEGWIEAGSTRGHQIGQEHLLNLNSAMIVLFVVPVSYLVARFRALTAMLGGMIVATLGILVSGLSASGWAFLAGVVFFSVGEMLTGPKKTEYLGAIAPPGKKGLYLGYVNIPVGIGQALGAQLSAALYARWGEKAMLAQRYLAEHGDELLGHHVAWDGEVATLGDATGVAREDAVRVLGERLGTDAQHVTDLLWATYHPWVVWLPIAGIGVVSAIALFAFNQRAKQWKDMNH